MNKANIILRIIVVIALIGGLLGMNQTLYAQQVEGTVIDETSGESLPGVNIAIKGTTTGTSTNSEGNYRLNVENFQDTLVFSFIGYQSREVSINGRTEIDIALQPQAVSGEELVVVGYGTQEEQEVTSSVTSVSSEEFNKGQVNNVAELIQGKVSGLAISRPGSNPNEEYSIRLRGLSTIGANTEPLIVIDGVPGASLNSVDPNDIASVSVLKDGSAAAIYGTRASSGVILITTKEGKRGSQVSYNGTYTANTVANTVPVLNAEQFRNFGGGQDFDNSTDWFDAIIQTGFSQSHNLSLSGGTDQTTYRASLNFRDGKGIERTTGYTQINGRLNLQKSALSDKLQLNAILSVTTEESDLGFDDAFYYATIYNPTAPIRSDDPAFDDYGGYFQQSISNYINPVSILQLNENKEKGENYNISLKADYELIDELTISGFYAREKRSMLSGTYYDKNDYWIGRGRNGLAERTTNESFNQLFQSTVNYDNTFLGNLNVEGLAGYSYQDFFDEGFSAEGGNFISDEFSFNNLAASLDFTNGLGSVNSYANSHKLVAFFGRFNFNYDNTYFLSSSVRHESSSRFGENYKWGTFPSISGGIAISNLVDIPFANFLKLRASYGITGNDAPSSYLSKRRYGPQDGEFYWSGSEYLPSYAPVSNPNPNLKWERKKELDIGLDFELLQGDRLSGSVDYYRRITNDLLLDFGVPVPPNLFDRTWVNIGALKNNGFEAAINYAAVDRSDAVWEIGATYSTFNTRLGSLSNEDLNFGNFRLTGYLGSPGLATNVIRVEENKQLGLIWGPVFKGIDSEGSWVFRDINGDGTIDDSDKTVIGNGLPDFQIGFNNTFQYKSVDLNLFFRGVFGHDLVNAFRAFYENPTLITSYNILESTREIEDLSEAPQFSSYHVEDASYLRLQNATIGYNLPLEDNMPISRLRVYVTGQNLFTITKYKGVDPEVRFDDNGDPLAPGIDRRDTWFSTRTFTLGINIEF